MPRLFRETLWFKKGLLDAEAPDQADLLPIEDRYLDDGSVTAWDIQQLSLAIAEAELDAEVSPSTRRTTR